MNLKKTFIVLSTLIIAFTSFPLLAQETEGEDPFSDYSYLWEDSKAKEKEAKRKAKEEAKKKKAQDKLRKQGSITVATDTVKTDSLQTSTPELDSLNLDSLNTTSNIVADTIPEPIPADTVRNEVIDSVQTQDPIDDSIEIDQTTSDSDNIDDVIEERTKKEKKKREAAEIPPINDFRSGMSSEPGGEFNGGFTFTQIGGQNYVGMVLSPEFKIWKLGLGLNVPILYGLEDQKIRTEIFKDGVGAARLIRYLRYGTQKVDPVYVKAGELDGTMIGFGGLINNYTNSTSYEKRKVGLHYDINVKGLAGIEGMYSDFDPNSFNLFAIRPYVRPLATTGIPIIKTFEIGSTIVRDKDQTQRPTSDSTFVTNTFTADGVGAFGIDAGMTLLRVPFIQIDFFLNWSKLNMESTVLTDSLSNIFTADSAPEELADGYADGSGFSAGLNFRMHFIADVFSTDVRIERLTYNEHYLPQFFDTNYELQKDAKILSLGSAQSMSGIYGSITGHVLNKVQIGGSLMIPDEISESSPALVRINADLDRLADKISLHGSYIKGDLSDLKDAFTFDERSVAKLRFIYHMNKFLAAGLDYYWAFAQVEDGSFKATKYVAPYFGLSIQF